MHVRRCFNKYTKSVLREYSYQIRRRRRGSHMQTLLIARVVLRVKFTAVKAEMPKEIHIRACVRESMCKSYQLSFHKIIRPTSGKEFHFSQASLLNFTIACTITLKTSLFFKCNCQHLAIFTCYFSFKYSELQLWYGLISTHRK